MRATMQKLRRPRWFVGLAIVVALATAFVALGLWQLGRLDERRLTNDVVAAALAMAPVPLDQVDTSDVAPLVNRRVVVEGEWLGELEAELVLQSRSGQAGVHIVTPLRTVGDQTVLVDRGFAPLDASGTFERASDKTMVTGRLMATEDRGRLVPNDEVRPAFSTLDPLIVGPELGLDLPEFYIVLESSIPGLPEPVPQPEPPPSLGEGPHLSYALQWFSFAAIVTVGYALLLHRRG